MAIYRYRKIDKDNLDAWENNQLWFSPLDKLDDAFEMWCHFDAEEFSAYSKQTQMQSKEFVSNFKKEKKKAVIFCCFSKSPDIPLMWAHYGDGLSGVCIEYDESVLELNGKQLLLDEIHYVEYPPNEDIPYCNIYTCHINDKEGQGDDAYAPAFKALFLTKSKDWSYQEEIRLLWSHDKEQGVPVNRAAIKSIIFGERADPKQIELVRHIFGESMTYKTARRSATHYKIEIVDNPSP